MRKSLGVKNVRFFPNEVRKQDKNTIDQTLNEIRFLCSLKHVYLIDRMIKRSRPWFTWTLCSSYGSLRLNDAFLWCTSVIVHTPKCDLISCLYKEHLASVLPAGIFVVGSWSPCNFMRCLQTVFFIVWHFQLPRVSKRAPWEIFPCVLRCWLTGRHSCMCRQTLMIKLKEQFTGFKQPVNMHWNWFFFPSCSHWTPS